MKNMNRLGDDMNRMARNNALAAIKAGQVRKDNAIRDLIQPRMVDMGMGDPDTKKLLKQLMK